MVENEGCKSAVLFYFVEYMDYRELIRKITFMSPELMYKGKALVDVTKVLEIIRDAQRASDGVLQNNGVEEMSRSLHESDGQLVRNLLAKGHLLSRVHSPS